MSVFNLPDLGEGLAEAEIVEWHVAVGDVVTREQLLVSVETAKAVVEIPSPQAGRILRLYAPAGGVVATGAALVEFADAGEARPTKADAGSVVGTLPVETQESSGSFIIGRHRHTEARLQQRPRPVKASRPGFEGGEALHGLRRQMAVSMEQAHQEVALVTIFDEALITWKGSERPLPRLIRALCQAVAREPALNAWYDGAGKTRLLHAAVHIGIAMDTAAGLLVPTLRDAQGLSGETLEQRLRELKQGAAARTLGVDELRGATITLSVHGSIGGRFATPLVTPPQVAIVGAGTIYQRLAPDAAQGYRTVDVLPISLSVDHRAITGGEAARFLAALIDELQSG